MQWSRNRAPPPPAQYFNQERGGGGVWVAPSMLKIALLRTKQTDAVQWIVQSISQCMVSVYIQLISSTCCNFGHNCDLCIIIVLYAFENRHVMSLKKIDTPPPPPPPPPQYQMASYSTVVHNYILVCIGLACC